MKPPSFALLCVLLVSVVAGQAEAQTLAKPPSPKEGKGAVQALEWMSGCWRRQDHGSGVVVDEQWMAPRAGMALGAARTVRGDSMVTEFEQLRIFQRAGRAVYHAEPSGQTPSEFVAAATSDTLVVFENTEHDFPQRVIYRRRGADSLLARVEGSIAGVSRAIDFPYGRVECK